MAQYYVYKQGTDKFRNGIRGGYYVTDIVLTALGFAGSENTDWKCIDKVLIPLAGPNGAPSNLVLTVKSDTELTVSFSSTSTNQTGYRAYISTDNSTFTEKTTNPATTFDLTGLTAGTLYFIYVVAYIGSKESSATNIGVAVTNAEWFQGNWFIAGNTIPIANCKAAYSPAFAANIAASYSNLAHPGTNDAVSYNAGDQPSLSGTLGWDFNGNSQYLKTGLVPVNDKTWSMFIRFSGYTSGVACIGGLYHAGTNSFFIQLTSAASTFISQNGSSRSHLKTNLEKSAMINGDKLALDGWECETYGANSGTITRDIWIAAINNGTPSQYFMGEIALVAIYDIKLSADQLFKMHQRSLMLYDPYKITVLNYILTNITVMICWNMPTFMNTANEIPPGDMNPNTFAPTGYDMDQWLDAISDAGFTRAILTAKAHDGFMLWPSAQAAPAHSPYTVAATTWYANNGSPDVVADFVNGCRSRGIRPCLYYSPWDKTHEARTGTDETTDAAAYIAMIEAQLTELLTNYGAIDSLWLDGWILQVNMVNVPWATIYNFIKGIQPNCVVINNRGGAVVNMAVTEIVEYEMTVSGSIPADNIYPAEEIDTMRVDNYWYYHAGLGVADGDMNTAAAIQALVNQAAGRHGTYCLAIQPTTAGVLPAAQVTRLSELGALL